MTTILILVAMASLLLVGMAISGTSLDSKVPGSRKLVIREITLDSAYPTNGEAVAAADLGLNGFDFCVPLCTNSVTYDVRWDQANKKLVMLTSADGLEVANGTDLSAVKVYVLASGW